jgi:hypothetical protein
MQKEEVCSEKRKIIASAPKNGVVVMLLFHLMLKLSSAWRGKWESKML